MEPRREERATPTAEQAMAALSRRECPQLAEALVAVAAAWRPMSRTDIDARLDALARPLFAIEPTAQARADALAELIALAFEPDARALEGLWLDEVLTTRRGHPALIAAVAAELGQRAGWDFAICSTPTAWYTGLLDDGRLWLIDPTGAAHGVGAPALVRRHCAHELAYVVLTGLAERFPGPRDAARARGLRDRLALFAPPEDPGRALLGALWSESGQPR
jgi:hypothetical protein